MPFTKKDINQITEVFKIFKPREKFGVYYQNISIIGLLCILLMIYESSNLLIPFKTLIIIGIISTISITLIFFRFYKRELGIIWSFFHNITIGFIIVFLFIKSNDYFSNKKVELQNYHIEKLELEYKQTDKNSYLSPKIIVKLNDKEAELTMSSYYLKEIQNTKFVEIGVKEGFWNFPIIKSIKPIENNVSD